MTNMNYSVVLRNWSQMELMYPYYMANNRTGCVVQFANRPPEVFPRSCHPVVDQLAYFFYTDTNRMRSFAKEITGNSAMRKPPLVLSRDMTLMPVKMRTPRNYSDSFGYVVLQQVEQMRAVEGKKSTIIRFYSGHEVEVPQLKRSLLRQQKLARMLTDRYAQELRKRRLEEAWEGDWERL